MLTDIDKEFDTPILDENGEPIEVIEIEEVFGDVNNQEPIEQVSYEGIENDIVQEGVEEEQVNISEEIIVEGKENYNNAKEQLVAIFTSILEVGEITAEDNVNIQQVKEQYTQAYNDIKENTENVKKKTLEERLQELTDGMVSATTDDILAILTDNGRKPWLYKDDEGNVLMDGTSIPELTILLNKLNLIATDGENEGEIKLSPGFIDLIATSTIVLTATNINLNGYISNDGGNFALDQQGNMEVQDLSVKGEFSCESLTLNTLNNPRYPEALDGSMNIFVDAANGSDDNKLGEGAVFQTLMGALKSIPKNLNGKTINIQLNSNITETVSVDWFGCGRLRIFFGGNILYGTYTAYRTVCMHEVYGGTIDNSMGSVGTIMPYDGKSAAGISASVLNYGSPDMAAYNVKVYEAKTLASGCTESAGIACGSNGYIYTRAISIVGCDYGFRTNANGKIYDDSSDGKARKYGFISVSGGEIKLSNGVHTGGEIDNTYESSGGEVKKHSATFTTTVTSGTNTSTPAPTIKTEMYTSNYGDTYRTTYSSWRNEGKVIQGNAYGSGDCRGYWFFGSQFAALKGMNISKVVLKVKRLKMGAWGSSISFKLAYHNYSSKPTTPSSSTPTYFQSVTIPAYSDSSDNYTSIIITNQSVLDGIKNGTIKGFGLYDSNYASSSYGGASGTATVTITYTE